MAPAVRTTGELASRDDGSALLVALAAVVLLSSLGLGLVVISDTERLIASNFQATHEGRYAAEAALERALADVRRATTLTALLAGTGQSSFVDTSLTPVTPWGSAIDLVAMTAAVQSRSDASVPSGPNRPAWRLLAFGPVRSLANPGAIRSVFYVAVWVADDPSETDGDPAADENGIVNLVALALGPSLARYRLRATVDRSALLRLLVTTAEP